MAINPALQDPNRIPNGTVVVVTTELGDENGIVLGSTNIVIPGEKHLYTVLFEDGTSSTWGSHVVRPRLADPTCSTARSEDGSWTVTAAGEPVRSGLGYVEAHRMAIQMERSEAR